MHYKDLIAKSLFLKDLGKNSSKSLIPKDRTWEGDLRRGTSRLGQCWEEAKGTRNREPKAEADSYRAIDHQPDL